MSGMDLSQSMTQESGGKRKAFLDIGLIISFALLALVLAGWGGLHFYLRSLDQKIAAFDDAIAANAKQLEGDHIDRVADFDTRVSMLGADPAESVDPRSLLTALEASMVPGIVLTGYEFDDVNQMSTISGRAEDFKKLAGQLMSLKAAGNFTQVKVDQVDRDQEGRINFKLKAYLH